MFRYKQTEALETMRTRGRTQDTHTIMHRSSHTTTATAHRPQQIVKNKQPNRNRGPPLEPHADARLPKPAYWYEQ